MTKFKKMAQNLNETTIKAIKDLQKDLENMLKMKSNIEVAWKLEFIHNSKALLNNAEQIKDSLRK